MVQSVSNLGLDAFLEVAQERSFSRAAKRLHVTQSALSQRVRKLEEEMGTTLFTRLPRETRLTAAGERLLRYCQTRAHLELELRSDLGAGGSSLAGSVRLAGYSSVARSVLLPAIAPLVRANPRVEVQLFNREMRHLPGMLRRAEADYIVLDYEWQHAGVETVKLGVEEYVLVESRKYPPPPDVFLDHDPEDDTTERFLRRDKAAPAPVRRSYFDEIYALIDGVAEGLGRAVISRHLAKTDRRLRIDENAKPMRVPVVLHHLAQPYYSRLQEAVLQQLKSGCSTLAN